ncbi:hypothetical protein KAR91_19700 [Candidatus Pacearchaeota archaeon]|nr:hypothetical protein [Candidatus Pacearchaeota archaeon]
MHLVVIVLGGALIGHIAGIVGATPTLTLIAAPTWGALIYWLNDRLSNKQE